MERKTGFTLIEIVIVLAISSLIILVIFLAISAAQRSQRDQVRKQYVDRVKGQLETWYSNHDGTYPQVGAEQSSFVSDAMGGNVVQSINFTYDWSATSPVALCSGQGEAIVYIDMGSRPASVSGCLEAGSLYRP